MAEEVTLFPEVTEKERVAHCLCLRVGQIELENSGPFHPASSRQLASVGASSGMPPAIFLRSEQSAKRFWEFFTANIRNRNTRKAYFMAVSQFADWCEKRKLPLEEIRPIHVAA